MEELVILLVWSTHRTQKFPIPFKRLFEIDKRWVYPQSHDFSRLRSELKKRDFDYEVLLYENQDKIGQFLVKTTERVFQNALKSFLGTEV